jgi:two-component system C4-dicarboxylate transport sensor histidine kinase DctB
MLKGPKALYWLLGLMLLLLIVLTHTLLRDSYLQLQASKQLERVEVYQSALYATLSRHDYLPQVLSENDELFEKAYQNPDEASQILESIRSNSQADFVFILRPDGTTIASSNWQDSENSFVGKNYSFRPYFTEALKQGNGTFFGIGATTNIPGYFVSSRYPETGPVTAVTAVKVNSSSLDKNWKSDEESVFVSDRNGVIVLSSNTNWRYKTLKPLADAQRQEIKKQQQFGNEPLSLLVRKSSQDNEFLVEIQGVRYLETTAEIGKMGWKIHYLAPYAVVQSQLVSFWSKAIILALIALAALLLIRTTNTRNALRVSQGESIKLRELNQSLEHEIVERRQVEAALRKAEIDLRRTSKLTAMGQLSASITHELGQPLSAMRTYMASMGQSRSPEAHQKTLGKLTLLVDRMISITQQLRYFARSGDKEIRSINLLDTIEGALNITQPAIQGGSVMLNIKQPDEPVYVIAGSVRIEQVLVNLIRNALDAMQDNDENSLKQLLIVLKQTDEHAILTVEDTGSGLSEESIKMLYEPFYSTKPSGIGMGLGLAISTNIIAELGGTMLGENRDSGGARFVVTLNRQKSA